MKPKSVPITKLFTAFLPARFETLLHAVDEMGDLGRRDLPAHLAGLHRAAGRHYPECGGVFRYMVDALHFCHPKPQGKLIGLRMRPYLGTGSFGQIASIVYLLSVIGIGMAQLSRPQNSRALLVSLVRLGVSAPPSSGIQPLVVRIELKPKLGGLGYVNSKPVAWQDFDHLVAKELSLRPPDWPVYLDGHPDIEWRIATEAIDRIHGLHAPVVRMPGRKTRGQLRP